MMTCRNNALI
ncbi:hypothetical protein FWK35_00016722 [Aphis craccivora]|uniref:Uncharacterized protein n=1 Tax=Aphis craccivora TaxID=307492 RepID=A0A6G0YD08_APHCR|nr:hypothetical protein FWK35_00016722 [Aphis craccivora]